MCFLNSIDSGRTWGPTQWGDAYATYSVFGWSEDLGASGIDFCRAMKSLMGRKKKDTLESVSFFLCHPNTIDANIAIEDGDLNRVRK